MRIDNLILEICASDIVSAINAQNAGANRIELCDNLIQGGTTPSYGLINKAREELEIQLNVMIRPRSGDFYYSDYELEIMKEDIRICKDLKVDGVVFGVLNKSNEIDEEITLSLVQMAKPMSVTFHRAIDLTKDLMKSVAILKSLNIDRILTSGGATTASEGIDTISKMVDIAGEDIMIMAGGGINSEHVMKIIEYTNVKEVHFSAKKKYKKTEDANTLNNFSEKIQGEYYYSDFDVIQDMVLTLQNIKNK
ncbi:MAG: copper homeostasis protein CutC [Saprospiraceae bacterium]